MESGTSDTVDSTTTWTHNDVQALMCVWGERRVQVQLEAAAPNQTVYLEIAQRLSALGVERTGQQCREKMEELKQDYKKAKDNEGQSGADRTTWFDALDAILDRAGPSKVMESATAKQAIDDTVREILQRDQDTDEEWQPNREDSGSGCSSPFQNASDTESDEAQPTTKARLPPVGRKRTKGDTESRKEQPTSRSSKRAKRNTVTAASSTDEETSNSSDDTTVSATPQQNRKRRREVEVEATLKDSNTDSNLFMECETEEFDPWRGDDDDDDEADDDGEHCSDADTELDSGEEWRPSREDIGSRLPSVGSKNGEHCPDADTELDSGDEWRPRREDIGSRSNSPFQRSPSPFQNDSEHCSDADTELDSGDELRPSREDIGSRLPSVGSKNGGGGRPDRRPLAADPPEWSEMNWQPKHIPFTATPGPINGAADLDSDQPVDFLELFLTDELLQVIVDRSNLYAEQVIKTIKQPHSRVNDWKALTVPDLKNFLGLLFLTGLIHKPEMDMYWSTDEALNTPFFTKTMSRNRYRIIWRFLHFSDDESADATDRLYEIRPVLDYLISKFREMYQPNANICIDEGMLLWRGRLSFKVYNPQKPVKYGIKSYILCDSETGYCLNMKPYCGKYAALGDTVEGVLGDLAGQGYRLYMDNYYNSVKTCERLMDLKTHVCGTLRTNRGEPPSIRQATKTDLQVGETIARHNDKVMVLAWRDKRIVRMITTFHQSEMQEVQENKKGHSDKVTLLKPSCVVAYNKSMNGVDRMDQNIVYYPFIRRSNKWTKKFVAYLFQISLFNAFTIYRAKNPLSSCKHLLSFIQSVVKSWTSVRAGSKGARRSIDPLTDNRCIRATKEDPHSRLDAKIALHELILLPRTGKKLRPSRKCRVCAKKNVRSDTRYYCKSCKVPLHHGKCHTLYHSKLNYAE